MAEPEGCCICGEEYGKGDNPEQPKTLPCQHTFGSKCIRKWLKPPNSARGCPLCRIDPADFYESGILKQRGPLSGQQTTTWSFEPISTVGRNSPAIYYDIDGIVTKDPRAAVLLMWIGLLASEHPVHCVYHVVSLPAISLAMSVGDVKMRLREIRGARQPLRQFPAPFRMLFSLCDSWYRGEFQSLTFGSGTPVIDTSIIRLAIIMAVLRKPQLKVNYKSRIFMASLLIAGTEAAVSNSSLKNPDNDLYKELEGSFPQLQALLYKCKASEGRLTDPDSRSEVIEAYRQDILRDPWRLEPRIEHALLELADQTYAMDWNSSTSTSLATARIPSFQTAGVDVGFFGQWLSETEGDRKRRLIVAQAVDDVLSLRSSEGDHQSHTPRVSTDTGTQAVVEGDQERTDLDAMDID